MTTPKPTIADLFDAFFADAAEGQSPAAERRTLRVRSSLEHYLDAEGAAILTTDQLALLHTERQFAPHGAFVRTMFADDLLFALPGYLDPRFRSPDAAEARSEVVVVGKLVQWMWTKRLFDGYDVSCILRTLESALAEARRSLGTTRGAAAR
ncbi:hypothetical protein [Planctomonas psychrotolerans]|uniref:hypothetical protein n=1 Tax=Planctomonas psychrotolerans TaxID=2528712 RepID=UPI00123B7ABE|nr:hypothetical protein [Planctomonas psychrotolerans]